MNAWRRCVPSLNGTVSVWQGNIGREYAVWAYSIPVKRHSVPDKDIAILEKDDFSFSSKEGSSSYRLKSSFDTIRYDASLRKLCSWKTSICSSDAIETEYWLVVWNMFYFSIQLGISSSQLTFIFFRGVGRPPTSIDLPFPFFFSKGHDFLKENSDPWTCFILTWDTLKWATSLWNPQCSNPRADLRVSHVRLENLKFWKLICHSCHCVIRFGFLVPVKQYGWGIRF